MPVKCQVFIGWHIMATLDGCKSPKITRFCLFPHLDFTGALEITGRASINQIPCHNALGNYSRASSTVLKDIDYLFVSKFGF